jgi:hypothetical protein
LFAGSFNSDEKIPALLRTEMRKMRILELIPQLPVENPGADLQ